MVRRDGTNVMIKYLRLMVAAAALAAATSPCLGGESRLGRATSQEIFRDSSGRTVGTSTTDSAGTITVRDASGRTVITGSCSDPGRCKLRDNPRFFLEDRP